MEYKHIVMDYKYVPSAKTPLNKSQENQSHKAICCRA